VEPQHQGEEAIEENLVRQRPRGGDDVDALDGQQKEEADEVRGTVHLFERVVHADPRRGVREGKRQPVERKNPRDTAREISGSLFGPTEVLEIRPNDDETADDEEEVDALLTEVTKSAENVNRGVSVSNFETREMVEEHQQRRDPAEGLNRV